MKKLFLMAPMFLLISFAVAKAPLSRLENVGNLLMETEEYISEARKLIELHEREYEKMGFISIDGDTLKPSEIMTSNFKTKLRTRFRADMDSILVRITKVKELVP